MYVFICMFLAMSFNSIINHQSSNVEHRQQDLIFLHDEKLRRPTNPAAEQEVVSVSRRLRASATALQQQLQQEQEEGDTRLVPLLGLRVIVTDPSEAPPQLETDESYTIEIPAPTAPTGKYRPLGVMATLRAPSVYGALRGLESFSQLVTFDWAHQHQHPQGEGVVARPVGRRYLLPAGTPLLISDRPRFPWRGLLVDTSRHFQPVRQLKVSW